MLQACSTWRFGVKLKPPFVVVVVVAITVVVAVVAALYVDVKVEMIVATAC